MNFRSARTMRRLSAVLFLLFALVGAGTAQAGFAPTNEPIVEARNLQPTGIDSDAQGNSLLAWSQDPTGTFHELKARRVSATGTLGLVFDLAPGETGFRPSVAMTPSGRAFVAWRVILDSEPDSVKGRWVEPDGVLGPLLTLAKGEAGVQDAGNVEAVVDPAGVVTVAWENVDANTFEMRRVAPDGTLGPLVEDVGDGGVTNPVISALPNGSTVAVWRNSGSEKNVVTAANVVGTVEKISVSPGAGDNEIASDAAGNSLVVWRQIAGDEHAVRGRRLDPSGATVGPEITIEPPAEGFVGSRPSVAADSVGNFLVSWNRQDAVGNATVFARGLDGAGVFKGPEQTVSAPGTDAGADLPALLDGGSGVIAWQDSVADADPVVGRSVNSLGAPTGGIEPLFADGFGPDLVSSVPAAGFAAYLVEYAVDGATQGTVLRRFMVPPTCAASSATAVQGSPVTVPISCGGPAFEGVQVIEQPRHGTLSAFGPLDRSFVYVPRPGYDGPDGFTFQGLNDGGASAPARVTIDVGKETVEPRIKKLKFIRKGKKLRLVFSEPATAVVRLKAVTRSDGKRRIKPIGKVNSRKSPWIKATIKVKGKLAKRLAAGGRFRAIAIATDLAKNKSKPKRISFKLNG
ncbi:MAG TPA: hypothetical protein VD741_04390 [Solirubrobacterales bacterium]|nr:hypothetical protein [Solirubrobacterales bacterium]